MNNETNRPATHGSIGPEPEDTFDGLALINPAQRFHAQARAMAYRALFFLLVDDIAERTDDEAEVALRLVMLKKRAAARLRRLDNNKAQASAENAEDIIDDLLDAYRRRKPNL